MITNLRGKVIYTDKMSVPFHYAGHPLTPDEASGLLAALVRNTRDHDLAAVDADTGDTSLLIQWIDGEASATVMYRGMDPAETWQMVDAIVKALDPFMAVATEVAVTMANNGSNTVPWFDACERCTGLRAAPEPGLFTYREVVARHFLHEHAMSLIQG